MRTAIFVYEPITININTNESDLELSGMDTGSVPLAHGDNARSIARGMYQVLSDGNLTVPGDEAAFDVVVTTQNKEHAPTPPGRAVTLLASVDAPALHAV